MIFKIRHQNSLFNRKKINDVFSLLRIYFWCILRGLLLLYCVHAGCCFNFKQKVQDLVFSLYSFCKPSWSSIYRFSLPVFPLKLLTFLYFSYISFIVDEIPILILFSNSCKEYELRQVIFPFGPFLLFLLCNSCHVEIKMLVLLILILTDSLPNNYC